MDNRVIMKRFSDDRAKARLNDLLDAVEQGESFEITRDGKAVAILAPAEQSKEPVAETIAAIRNNRRHARLDGIPIRELIEEGRRY